MGGWGGGSGGKGGVGEKGGAPPVKLGGSRGLGFVGGTTGLGPGCCLSILVTPVSCCVFVGLPASHMVSGEGGYFLGDVVPIFWFWGPECVFFLGIVKLVAVFSLSGGGDWGAVCAPCSTGGGFSCCDFVGGD